MGEESAISPKDNENIECPELVRGNLPGAIMDMEGGAMANFRDPEIGDSPILL